MNTIPIDQNQLNLWLLISAYGLLVSPMSDSAKKRTLEAQIKQALANGATLPGNPMTGVASFDNAIATYLSQLQQQLQQAQIQQPVSASMPQMTVTDGSGQQQPAATQPSDPAQQPTAPPQASTSSQGGTGTA